MGAMLELSDVDEQSEAFKKGEEFDLYEDGGRYAREALVAYRAGHLLRARGLVRRANAAFGSWKRWSMVFEALLTRDDQRHARVVDVPDP